MRNLVVPTRFLRHGKASLAVAVVTALIAVGGGTAAYVHARNQSTPSIIYACVNNSSGTIKIVASTDTCHNNETPYNWNQQGPQGLTGPAGPQGPVGAT